MTETIRIRASKTSPHSRQQNPRHLLTLLSGKDDLETIAAFWGKPSGVVQYEVAVGYNSTDKCIVLVNPQDAARVSHYDAMRAVFRPNPQEGENRFRLTLSGSQVPWLAKVDPVGLCYADLAHQPETNNLALYWAEYKPPRHVHRRAMGKMLSLASVVPKELAEKQATRYITPGFAELSLGLSPAVINSVHLHYSDGSLQNFDRLTLAQMVEIQNLLTRMTS